MSGLLATHRPRYHSPMALCTSSFNLVALFPPIQGHTQAPRRTWRGSFVGNSTLGYRALCMSGTAWLSQEYPHTNHTRHAPDANTNARTFKRAPKSNCATHPDAVQGDTRLVHATTVVCVTRSCKRAVETLDLFREWGVVVLSRFQIHTPYTSTRTLCSVKRYP
ncbi:hypothetical protein BD779DRAFT_298029 [Infundibulicybe gibba]|nr:hypothetical protein BD779DRAFT_298029 [Infundibulicybe gibba]